MFDKPKTTSYVAPATPIDVDQRYLLRVHKLTDLGISDKFPGDDPNNPNRRIQWDFQIATMEGEKLLDVDGEPWHYMDYTSSRMGKSTRAGGKTAVARLWIEAFFGKPLEDDEIGDDIHEQLIGKTAVALFEEKPSANGEYTNIKILKLSPRKGGSVAAAPKPKPAPEPELAF